MSGLDFFQSLGYRLFGRNLEGKVSKNLEFSLLQARISVRPEAYLGGAIIQAIVAGIFGLLIGAGGAFFLLNQNLILMAVVAPVVGMFLAGVVYLLALMTPKSQAKKRGKEIDLQLPYALRYLTSISSAGVTPLVAFESLGRQEVYGVLAEESKRLSRDLSVHGIDLITAMIRSARQSPSKRWKEVMQGAVSTVQSGGRLPDYFRDRTKRLQWEAELEQKSFIETMGLMGETYVTAAVAGPLFLIVLISVLVIMGNGAISQLQMIIYGLLPIIGLGFIFGIRAMIREV